MDLETYDASVIFASPTDIRAACQQSARIAHREGMHGCGHIMDDLARKVQDGAKLLILGATGESVTYLAEEDEAANQTIEFADGTTVSIWLHQDISSEPYNTGLAVHDVRSLLSDAKAAFQRGADATARSCLVLAQTVIRDILNNVPKGTPLVSAVQMVRSYVNHADAAIADLDAAIYAGCAFGALLAVETILDK